MVSDRTHDFDQQHVEPDPERALALAVINRAIEDLAGMSAATEAEQEQAQLFLFSETGPWARSRRAWAEEAGIEEEWLTRRLKERKLPQRKSHQRSPNRAKPGPKPGGTSEWDQRVLDHLHREGHLPGHRRRDKIGLERILVAAGFRAPRGGPVTRDTVYFFIGRHSDAFN